MKYNCWLQCIYGCTKRYSIYDVVYRCEECNGLLDVEHDITALKKLSGKKWRSLFENRTCLSKQPYNSGVWRVKECIVPQIENKNIVSLGEGNTPLLPARQLGQKIGVLDLWIKQCGTSHTGSFKDLGMTVLVSTVRQIITNGTPIRAVACASTGDTSAALSAYCAAAGIPSVVFLPRGKISTAQLVQPIANGALVLALDTDFDGCMSIVQQVTANKSIYLANSMNSLRIEGQKSMAIEIVQQFGWEVPDWVVIPSGNLGNVSALGRGFIIMKELGIIDRLPRIACAQSINANPLYLSYLKGFKEYQPVTAQKTLASAIQIGAPVSYERAVKILRMFDGVVEQVTEDELANAAARADRSGFYCCPQTSVALAALEKLAGQAIILPEQRVVVISTAHGLKFSRFKVDYHEQTLAGISARYANPPQELAADVKEVSRAINKYFSG